MAVVLMGWLVVLSVFDIRQRRLPNALTLPGFVVILLAAHQDGRLAAALVGAAALAGVYLVGFLLGGMGAGDVKLALGLGAVTGAGGVEAWVVAALGAPVLTVLLGLVARRRVVPHGPSMCLATALSFGICGV
jgi:leader peptidase (prepilin peptidase)/N-methyltransferase